MYVREVECLFIPKLLNVFLYPSFVFFLFQLFNKVVFLVSFVGNQGTFTRGYKAVVMDMLFIYHLGYAIICVLGLFVHEFFYSFLVRIIFHISLTLNCDHHTSETNILIMQDHLL